MTTARLFYPIKEIFLTIQGEGFHAGRRAVFVRTSGCNVWTGREEDRARDQAKGCCAAWCDTDFRGTDGVNGGKLTASQIRDKVAELWGPAPGCTVVVSGGEPSLVLDFALVDALHGIDARVHVETNGSATLPPNVDWVTLSPKPPMEVVLEPMTVDEVKVVYPAGVIPHDWDTATRSGRLFLQPLDGKNDEENRASLEACLAFIHQNPGWRLSLQTHKLIGVP